jgi:C4-dicarboxylate-binding protein DctP
MANANVDERNLMLTRLPWKLLGFTLALWLIAAASAQSRVIANNDIEENTIKGRAFNMLADLIDERLGDELKARVHHGSTLYSQTDQISALQLQAIHFIAPTVGVYTGDFPKLNVLVLPYLLRSPAAIQAALENPEIGGVLLEEMEAANLQPLAAWLNGPRDVGTSGQPILSLEDLKGVRIRVPPGDNYVQTFEALGASVTTIAWGEVPTALQQGIIDAVEPVPHAWVSSRMYELADQITLTEHIWDFYIMSTNKSWWDGLDPAVREELQDIIAEVTAANWEEAISANQDALEHMESQGAQIHELSAEEQERWRQAVRPVWENLGVPLVGQDVMDRLEEIGANN